MEYFDTVGGYGLDVVLTMNLKKTVFCIYSSYKILREATEFQTISELKTAWIKLLCCKSMTHRCCWLLKRDYLSINSQ